jgi:RNA polymerase sigma factor (sigma-70 family)
MMEYNKKLIENTSAERTPEAKLISINDYLLWKNFKAGDLSAYSLIYRKYFFVLFSYGKKISSDNELIKDCIQDLFIKIWNNRENLSDTTSVKYYLFTSLKNKLLDALESPNRRLKSDEDVLEFETIETIDSNDDAFYSQKERIFKAINKLSKHQQKVLEMKFYKNKSNHEIANELGITIQSVYNSVFKTLRSIRKQLQVVIMFVSLYL